MKENTAYINKVTLKQRLAAYRRRPTSFIMFLITWAAAIITATVVVILVAYILIRGIPNLKPSLFALEYNSENVSMLPAIINTVTMTVFSLVLAVPIGVFSAVYLTEYAKRGNPLVKVVRVTTETLAGNPVECLRSVRLSCFRYRLSLRQLNAFGCPNPCYYDFAYRNANDRGGALSRARFFQRG